MQPHEMSDEYLATQLTQATFRVNRLVAEVPTNSYGLAELALELLTAAELAHDLAGEAALRLNVLGNTYRGR